MRVLKRLGPAARQRRGAYRVLCYALLIMVMLIAGCRTSDRAFVTGRVTRQDGSPVVGSRVIFRSPTTGASASGVTDSDGYYQLGTVQKGDGIPPGEYLIAITEDRGNWDNPKPRSIHAKYESPKTSGLTRTIKSSHDTTFNMELETPNGSGR